MVNLLTVGNYALNVDNVGSIPPSPAIGYYMNKIPRDFIIDLIILVILTISVPSIILFLCYIHTIPCYSLPF